MTAATGPAAISSLGQRGVGLAQVLGAVGAAPPGREERPLEVEAEQPVTGERSAAAAPRASAARSVSGGALIRVGWQAVTPAAASAAPAAA